MMNEKRHANFAMSAGFVPSNAMQRALSHENCAMLMPFFLSCYTLLVFFLKKKTQIDCLFLKYVMIHPTSSCLLFYSTAWQFWMMAVEPFDI